MLTLPRAISRFDAASRAGEIPNRKSGARSSLKPSRRDPIISNVRKAVEHALQTLNGGRAVGTAVMEATDLSPLLLTLPEHGRLAVTEADVDFDPKAASKVESNVRLFVSVILGRDIVKDRAPVVRTRVLPAFQPLYDALDAWVNECPDERRSLRRGFVYWTELAAANGAGTPEQVPDDYAAIQAWGRRLGWKPKDVTYALNAWRQAVRLAGADYAMAWDLVVHNGLGIKSLPDFVSRSRAAGFTGDIAAATAADLLPYLAPKLGAALAKVVDDGLKSGLSAAWADDIRDVGSWAVAALLRLGEDAASLTWFDLWTVRREVVATVDAEQDDQLAQYGIAAGTGVAHHSLIRRMLDSTAARSYDISHLRLFNSEHEADPVPVYTDSLIRNMEAAFVVTHRFFGARMHQQRPELWAQATMEYDELVRHTTEYNKPRILRGRKARGKLAITWPQLLCMGIPRLARDCYELRRTIADRRERIGHLESRESQVLVNSYCDALTTYAVVALLADDSLRVKNYSGAMAGTHVKITPAVAADGTWRGIAELRTSFTALDADTVALKSKKVTNGEHNSRNRRVTPGIVDHTLWFEYWTLARPRALVAAGLLPNIEEFDPAHDDFAVFITPRPSSDQVADYQLARAEGRKPAWRGNLSEDMLSDKFGAALHRICVDVLGRKLPAWGSKELVDEYRGLFGAHIARLMVATWFGGVCGNWEAATYRTNDEEVTLRRHYVHLSAWAKEREHLEGPEGLRWFEKVVDRVLKLRSADDARWPQFWHAFDPEHPEHALAWLDRAPVTPVRRRRRRIGAAR